MDTAKLQMSPEMETLKTKLKATWVSGDFGKIAESFTSGAAEFVGRLNLKPGNRVLDAACGSGNQSIPAARAGARERASTLRRTFLNKRKNGHKAKI